MARAAYFVPGRDGMGVWPNSKIVHRPGAASVTNTSKTQKHIAKKLTSGPYCRELGNVVAEIGFDQQSRTLTMREKKKTLCANYARTMRGATKITRNEIKLTQALKVGVIYSTW